LPQRGISNPSPRGYATGVCMFANSIDSFRGMEAFYFEIENRREILNTTPLTKITAHKQL